MGDKASMEEEKVLMGESPSPPTRENLGYVTSEASMHFKYKEILYRVSTRKCIVFNNH